MKKVKFILKIVGSLLVACPVAGFLYGALSGAVCIFGLTTYPIIGEGGVDLFVEITNPIFILTGYKILCVISFFMLVAAMTNSKESVAN